MDNRKMTEAVRKLYGLAEDPPVVSPRFPPSKAPSPAERKPDEAVPPVGDAAQAAGPPTPAGDDRPGGLLSHPDLAKLHKLTSKQSEALRGRLARWRGSHQNGEYIEVPASDRRPKDPTYLYKPEEVQPLIQDIKRKVALAAKRRT